MVPPRRCARTGARAITAGSESGIASTGDHATNTQHLTVLPPEALVTPEAVPAPAGLMNLPVRRQLFVGRENALGWLDSAAQDPGVVVVQAVHGLGGVGKSALAAQWAATRAARYTLVWWITADSPAEIASGLAGLAVAVEPVLAQVLPTDALVERAVQWLACHPGWLLVLDNVDEPRDVHALLARVGHNGHCLITSRRATGWHRTARPLALDVLPLPEALDLLHAGLSHDPAATTTLDPADAQALCTDLGCLPLAIEQAGAYLAQNQMTAGEYRDLLTGYPAAMYAAAAEGTPGEQTIARTWQITLDRLADTPLAGDILRILAWYAPDDIPRNPPGRPRRTPRDPPRTRPPRHLQHDHPPAAAHLHRHRPGGPAGHHGGHQRAPAGPSPHPHPRPRQPPPHPPRHRHRPHPRRPRPGRRPARRHGHTIVLADLATTPPPHRGPPGHHHPRHHHPRHHHPDRPGREIPPRTRHPDPGDPPVRTGPHRLPAGPGRRPPQHPDLGEQPRLRLLRRRGTWAGRSPCSSRPSPTPAGPGRRPPRHPDRRRTTSPAPTTRRGIWVGRSPCTNRPSPTPAGPGRRPPRHPGLARTTSPPPTSRPGTWVGRSPCSSRPSPTAGGSWATTTPTP